MSPRRVKNVSSNKATVRLSSLRNKAHPIGRLIPPGETVDLASEFSEADLKKASVELLHCVERKWLEEVS